jgi:hypothetical protein
MRFTQRAHMTILKTGDTRIAALESSSQVDPLLTQVRMPGLLNSCELTQIIRVFKPKLSIIMSFVDSNPFKLPPGSQVLEEPRSLEGLLVSDKLRQSA